MHVRMEHTVLKYCKKRGTYVGWPPRPLTGHQVSKKRREKNDNKKAEWAAGEGRERTSERDVVVECVRNLNCAIIK